MPPTPKKKPEKPVVDYDVFRAWVQARKRECWAELLAGEEPGRLPGRRPRSDDKEALLTEMDRLRILRLPEGDVRRRRLEGD